MLMLITVISYQTLYASEFPKPGNKYKIIKPIYIYVDKLAKYAYLLTFKYSNRYVAFRTEVSTGTIMTIIGPAPRAWYLRLLYPKTKEFYVRLDPDLSRGLDITLELTDYSGFIGFKGNLDGLNPEIFRRLQDNEKNELK